MNFLKYKFAVAILLSFFSVQIAFSQTQLEINQSSCEQYEQADGELNRVYQQVLKDYKSDAVFIQKFKQAQRTWITFRDAYIDSLYPAVNPRTEYGSIYPTCRCLALLEITQKRTEELNRWIEGIEEGDACSGSIKIKQN
jgi:uncharacterized protein YecT (DUF1311 family)